MKDLKNAVNRMLAENPRELKEFLMRKGYLTKKMAQEAAEVIGIDPIVKQFQAEFEGHDTKLTFGHAGKTNHLVGGLEKELYVDFSFDGKTAFAYLNENTVASFLVKGYAANSPGKPKRPGGTISLSIQLPSKFIGKRDRPTYDMLRKLLNNTLEKALRDKKIESFYQENEKFVGGGLITEQEVVILNDIFSRELKNLTYTEEDGRKKNKSI